MSAEKKIEYPYIRAWGRMMQSFSYYINDQVEQAKEDNAPHDAVFRRDDGTWQTFGGVTNTTSIAAMKAILKDMGVDQ